LRGLGFTERHRREISDADLIQLDVLRAAAHGLAMVDSIRGADFQTRALLLALQTGYRPQIARSLILESMLHSTQRNFPPARSLLERALAVAGDDPEPCVVALAPAGRGLVHYFDGVIDPAIECLREAVDKIRHVPGSIWELYSSRIFDVFCIRLR